LETSISTDGEDLVIVEAIAHAERAVTFARTPVCAVPAADWPLGQSRRGCDSAGAPHRVRHCAQAWRCDLVSIIRIMGSPYGLGPGYCQRRVAAAKPSPAGSRPGGLSA
jgi:hypothetical protein